MATRVPVDALHTAQYFTKQIPVDQVGEQIIRRALTRMWMAGPFTWTVGSGTSFNLVAGRGSYDLTYPTDYGYTVRADLISSSDLSQPTLTIVSHIEDDDGLVGNPSRIHFTGPAGLESLVRISPVPATFDGTPRVVSLYKRTCPVYEGAAIHDTVVPFPDDWYWVYEEIVLYEAYRYADDSRAGEAGVKGADVSYNGQMAVFQAALAEMRLREPLVVLTDKPQEKDPSK